jgi:E3 SUMO-protein ligase PIAS1
MQKFYLSLIVCKSVPVETLVSQIQKKIRKESVIAESEFLLQFSSPISTNILQSRKRPTTTMWLLRRRI